MTTSFGASDDAGTVTAATVNEQGNIVVGDKVYSPEALSKKLMNQDAHIATLESENSEHISNSTKLLDRLDSIEKKVTDKDDISSLLSTIEQNTQTTTAPTEDNTDTPVVSKDELVADAVAVINQQNQEQTKESNLAEAVKLAKETYGEGFSEKIDELGLSLGMSIDSVIELAKTQPNAWKKLFIPKTDDSRAPDPTDANGLAPSTPPPAERKGGYVAMRNSRDQRAEFKRRIDAAMGSQQ